MDDDHEVDIQQLLRSLPTREGVTKDDIKELIIWLGPQAHSLRGGIRLIDLLQATQPTFREKPDNEDTE